MNGANDWSASVLACHERRFDVKTPVKILWRVMLNVFFALRAYGKRGRLRSSRKNIYEHRSRQRNSQTSVRLRFVSDESRAGD